MRRSPRPGWRQCPYSVQSRSGSEPSRRTRCAGSAGSPWSPGPRLDDAIELIRGVAQGYGRDPDGIGVEGRVNLSQGIDAAAKEIQDWRARGATHVGVNTMGTGASGVDGHIIALAELAQAIGLPARPVS